MDKRRADYLANYVGKTDWEEEAKASIKAELKRSYMSYADLAARLTESGMPMKEPALRNKISRGNFSASFFLRCLAAIGCSHTRIGRGLVYVQGHARAAIWPAEPDE
jgi:hypothetical protein